MNAKVTATRRPVNTVFYLQVTVMVLLALVALAVVFA